MKRTLRASAAVLLAAVASSCARDPGPPLNVVLITVDTLRADRLGCYGYFRDTSPHLDELARQSVLFERCFAPIATTFPAHLALLTATHPLEHGAVANVANTWRPFAPTDSLRSLAQLLKEAGYATRAAVSATPLKMHSGLDIGFDEYDEPEKMERPAGETNEAVLRWIPELAAGGPFFLWAHYYDPHDPYSPPAPWDGKWKPDAAQRTYLEERGFTEAFSQYSNRYTMPELNDLYDGEVSYVDAEIGRVLAALRDADVWDRTLVLVVGDHGEALGQHDEHSHGNVWLEQLRVPLIVRAPGLRARRFAGLLGLRDVLPSVLDLVDLPVRDPLLLQATGESRMRRGGETLLVGQESGAPWRRRDAKTLYSLIGEEWRLVHDAKGEDLLYDLVRDPFELRDVAAEHPERAERLRNILLERLADLTADVPDGKQTLSIDPRVVEEMRALGYVE